MQASNVSSTRRNSNQLSAVQQPRICRTCGESFSSPGTLCPKCIAPQARARANEISESRERSNAILAQREASAKGQSKRTEFLEEIDLCESSAHSTLAANWQLFFAELERNATADLVDAPAVLAECLHIELTIQHRAHELIASLPEHKLGSAGKHVADQIEREFPIDDGRSFARELRAFKPRKAYPTPDPVFTPDGKYIPMTLNYYKKYQ